MYKNTQEKKKPNKHHSQVWSWQIRPMISLSNWARWQMRYEKVLTTYFTWMSVHVPNVAHWIFSYVCVLVLDGLITNISMLVAHRIRHSLGWALAWEGRTFAWRGWQPSYWTWQPTKSLIALAISMPMLIWLAAVLACPLFPTISLYPGPQWQQSLFYSIII